jgi:hypothetical protein
MTDRYLEIATSGAVKELQERGAVAPPIPAWNPALSPAASSDPKRSLSSKLKIHSFWVQLTRVGGPTFSIEEVRPDS